MVPNRIKPVQVNDFVGFLKELNQLQSKNRSVHIVYFYKSLQSKLNESSSSKITKFIHSFVLRAIYNSFDK